MSCLCEKSVSPDCIETCLSQEDSASCKSHSSSGCVWEDVDDADDHDDDETEKDKKIVTITFIIFLAIGVIWAFLTIFAVIKSITCAAKTKEGSTGILGVVIAFFFGPFYFLYRPGPPYCGKA